MINMLNQNGYSQLMLVAISGDARGVRDLLLKHKDINVALMCTNPFAIGCTALVMAAFRGHIACVRLLLRANTESDRNLEELEHALFCAIVRGHAESVEAVLRHGGPALQHVFKSSSASITFMKYLILRRDTKCLEVMLDAGTCIGMVDGEGSTLLMLAAAGGCSECVRLLLEQDMTLAMHIEQLHATNNRGCSALAIAGNAMCADLIKDKAKSLIDQMECASTLYRMKRSDPHISSNL